MKEGPGDTGTSLPDLSVVSSNWQTSAAIKGHL